MIVSPVSKEKPKPTKIPPQENSDSEHEKQEARVDEVQQEHQDFVKKYESLEHDSKTQESELADAAYTIKIERIEKYEY